MLKDNFIDEAINLYAKRTGFFVRLSNSIELNGIRYNAYCCKYSGTDCVVGFRLVEDLFLDFTKETFQEKLLFLAEHLLKFYTKSNIGISPDVVANSFIEDIASFPDDNEEYMKMLRTVKLSSPYFPGIVISCDRILDELRSFLIIDKYGSVSRTEEDWKLAVRVLLETTQIQELLSELATEHKKLSDEIDEQFGVPKSITPPNMGRVIRPDVSVWGGAN